MMFKNYLLTFIRNFAKHKFYTLITMLSFSIAIACCFVVYLFILDELSFDQFHLNKDRIYRIDKRVLSSLKLQHGEADPYSYYAVMPGALAAGLNEEMPQVERATQIKLSGNLGIKYNEKAFEQNTVFVDSNFFKVFSFPVKAGTSYQLFRQPTDAAITEEAAQKFFDAEGPIGKTIHLDFENSTSEVYTIKAVISCPANSSIDFDVLLPLESYKPYLKKSWNVSSYPTFVVLKPGTHVADFEKRLNILIGNNRKDAVEQMRAFNNLPKSALMEAYSPIKLQDIHFDRKISWTRGSDFRYSLILGGIAILIISIASINYTSFALTLSFTRRKEIGIRKAAGAKRSQIFSQFNGESLILACIAAGVGVLLALLLLPWFNSLTLKEISFSSINFPWAISFLMILTLVIGLAAGVYPAIYLSKIKPALALKRHVATSTRSLSKPLLLLQFIMSAFLMISSIVMYKQMNFIHTKDLGYSGNNVIVVATNLGWGEESDRAIERFRNATKGNRDIESVSGASGSFIRGGMSMTYKYQGEEKMVYLCRTDQEYLATLNISLIQGRNFLPGSATDSTSIIVNEALVKDLGWTDPLSERLYLNDKTDDPGLKVIGVMKDYHFKSLEEEIKPMLLMGSSQMGSYMITLIVKLNGPDLPTSLSTAEREWKKIYPDKAFNYIFADDEVAAQYASYLRWTKINGSATFIAILIACLGLFGLAGIYTTIRTKEIGIRKVFGADIKSLFLLLNGPFVTLFAIAFLVATPCAWYAMQHWLNNFTYHTALGWETFVVSLFSGVLIILLTVSYHAVSIANLNPAETLRE